MNLTSINDIYTYAISLLTRREHFTKELIQKLQKKEIPCDLIDEAIEKLHERNYLDDVRATEIFVLESKRKKRGFIKIVNELRMRGVTGVESDVRMLYSKDEECEIAQKLLLQIHKPSKEKKYRYLFNRGFSPDVIRMTTAD